MYTLILLSGGKGTRMQNAIPKQYLLLAGKPVIMHVLEKVASMDVISRIVVVCAEEYIGSIRLMIEQYGIVKDIVFAIAGSTRQESVKAGLEKVNTEDVIIHEAARPFVKVCDFRRLIDAPFDNVTYGVSIPFTVLLGKDYVDGILERSQLFNVQLPQKFKYEQLSRAHERAYSEQNFFTEDASLLHYYYPETPIRIIEGMEYDIKLTTRQDLLLGELIYEETFRGRK